MHKQFIMTIKEKQTENIRILSEKKEGRRGSF